MSTLRTNEIQRTDGQSILKNTGSIIQTVVLRSDTKSTLDTTSFTEASSNYRVSITPTHADNRIILSYYVMCNTNLASNTLFLMRAEKYTSGSAASITSRSTGHGSNRYNADLVQDLVMDMMVMTNLHVIGIVMMILLQHHSKLMGSLIVEKLVVVEQIILDIVRMIVLFMVLVIQF